MQYICRVTDNICKKAFGPNCEKELDILKEIQSQIQQLGDKIPLDLSTNLIAKLNDRPEKDQNGNPILYGHLNENCDTKKKLRRHSRYIKIKNMKQKRRNSKTRS